MPIIYLFAISPYIEHQNVYITSDYRNERVPFATGMVPKDRTTGAVAINSIFFVDSADLHVPAIDSRHCDRPSSLAGIFFFR